MQPGDKVLIGGRTMLAPGFSLVGLTGIIVPSAPNAPIGTRTVAVDWHAAGYKNVDELPLFVNVPEAHLQFAEPATPEKEVPSQEKSPHEEPQDERPKLRLI